jgi:hypothetical protein
MSDKNAPKEVSDISAWIDGEIVTLPSNRNYKIRQLDVLDVLAPDGTIPNFLLPLLSNQQKEAEVSAEEMLKIAPLLNRVAEQSMVEPKIVKTMDEVNGRMGVLLSMVPMQDKLAMLSYAMGGAANINKAQQFLQKPSQPVESVSGKSKRNAEPEAQDS